jgi:arylsulfatase A-like enzyme
MVYVGLQNTIKKPPRRTSMLSSLKWTKHARKQGLYNNTMIIFTTDDNGMFHGSHGLAGKCYPYQESSICVPLIKLYDPRRPKDKVGTIDDSFTLNVDLAETILGATGLKPTKGMQEGREDIFSTCTCQERW